MAEYMEDYEKFRKVVEEGRIDNRTLVIELESCLNIKPQNINSCVEIRGCQQYQVRYNNILVIMYWDNNTASFSFPNYFGIYEGNNLKKLVHY